MIGSKEDTLQSLLQATTTGFYLLNRHCQVLFFNQAAVTLYKKITGCALYEGLDFVSQIAEERKSVVKNAVDSVFSGQITEYETKYLKPEKGWIKVRYSPAHNAEKECIGVCLTIDDITAKKELEEEALQRESKFHGIFHFSGIGMALVSTEGKLLDVNPALEKLWGYSREELLRLSFQEITHPDDLGQDLEYIKQLLEGEIESYQMENRYYHKNGSVVWGMLTVSLVRQAGGKPDFLTGQVIDISPVKAMINELEAKNNSLDFAAHDLEQKIQQLEEFTYMVGHNLRGPAANISVMADLIKQSSPEELPAWLDRLQQTANSLLSTLTELLTYSQVKLEAGTNYEECDIKAISGDAMAQVAGADILHGVTINYELGFTVVMYPKIYLKSILYNLLSNAVKYRKKDAHLNITVKTDELAGRKRLQISDDGIGFDAKKNRDKIFKLNSTFHKGYNSKGIGLFITKAQVEKLGGSISVQSMPEEGTTFSIIF
jgi:PAS domain S-box-containing protein